MVNVQFLKNHQIYTVGQVAHFPQPTAETLISIGVAKLYEEPKKNPPMPTDRKNLKQKTITK